MSSSCQKDRSQDRPLRNTTCNQFLGKAQTPNHSSLSLMIQPGFFYASSSLKSVTSQLKEEDAPEDCFKSPAKPNVDDIQSFGSTDLVIPPPKVIRLQVQSCWLFPIAAFFTCLARASKRTCFMIFQGTDVRLVKVQLTSTTSQRS